MRRDEERSPSASTRRSPIAAIAALVLGACSRAPSEASSATSAPAARVELLVYAATSTRDALLAIEPVCESFEPVDLVFNFGASGDLARQIVAAGKADVFLSADEQEMDRVERAGLVEPDTRRALLANQLVVVEPADADVSLAQPFTPAALADPAIVRLSIGDPATVPAGRYARAWLERAGAWSSVAERVLPAVDARAALAAVESGAAQAGIVYRTDAARSTRARLAHRVPLDDAPSIVYSVAAIAGRPELERARAVVACLASPAALGAFERAGFAPIAARAASGR